MNFIHVSSKTCTVFDGLVSVYVRVIILKFLCRFFNIRVNNGDNVFGFLVQIVKPIINLDRLMHLANDCIFVSFIVLFPLLSWTNDLE
jgi:uncharacterized protein YggT (Ycf19 family)